MAENFAATTVHSATAENSKGYFKNDENFPISDAKSWNLAANSFLRSDIKFENTAMSISELFLYSVLNKSFSRDLPKNGNIARNSSLNALLSTSSNYL